MQGHFLSLKESFIWEDNLTDRGSFIEDLNFAIDQARSCGDNIYRVPDLFNIQLSWGDFIQFLFETAYDDEERVKRFPWLTESQHLTLLRLLDFFSNTTEGCASNLVALGNEFDGQNSALIGLFSSTISQPFIHDEQSWKSIHHTFLSKFDRKKIIKNIQYFEKFYVPQLNGNGKKIRSIIEKGQSHKFFLRLDFPTTSIDGSIQHCESVHIHFKDNKHSALNIDGTWKHGCCKIPKEAGDILIKWGFKLPVY